MKLLNIYYTLKPLIPRRVQLGLRRWVVRWRRTHCRNLWPIFPDSDRPPTGWTGWPDGKKFALVLTHDVEYAQGHDKCLALAGLEERLGFRSSFNFVPERYRVSPEFRHELARRGFEVGVHGLRHDGKLFSSWKTFSQRATGINRYLRDWEAVGFRAPAMHHNLAWIHRLNIAYDASTFDTDPFEPQNDGLGTIFPQWIADSAPGKGYVELPYTLPQDSTLFLIMQETSIDIWKRKLDWVAARGGMALVNTHPDYMRFGDTPANGEAYPARLYEDFLRYIEQTYPGQYWHALPRAVAAHVRGEFSAGRLLPRNIPLTRSAAGDRVAMVVFSRYPEDIRVRREAEGLVEAGIPVDVICLKENQESDQETVRGVRVFRIRLKHKRTGVLRYAAEYAYFFVRAFVRLTRLYAQNRYRIVHAHNMPDFMVFVALIPRWGGARVLLDLHDPMPELFTTKFSMPPSSLFIRLIRRVERWSIGFADRVITTNLAFRDLFVARGCPSEKIHIVMNAPQESIFHPHPPDRAPAAAHPSGPFSIMYNGLIVERHGLDTAVEAVNRLRERIPGLELHIFGTGEFWPQVQARIDRLAPGHGMRYHGVVPIEQIAAAIRTMDLGIIPNRKNPFTDLNFPTRIMEFLCLGKSVVAPRTQGILDYFDADSLFLFEPDNIEDLCRAIWESYSNPAARQAKAVKGYETYSRYRWESQKQGLVDLTRSLLAIPHPETVQT